MKVSVIIPVLNEAGNLKKRLESLLYLKDKGHELIVVDGGSTDQTFSIAKKYSTQCVIATKGRAFQMNEGARAATGNVLLFLHADTVLSEKSFENFVENINDETVWGWFSVRLSGNNFMFRIIESLMNIRSCLTSVATGDQAIFVSRQCFINVAGYQEILLMEDIVLSKTLREIKKPFCIKSKVVTSSRRWHENGIIKTVILMWWLRLKFFA